MSNSTFSNLTFEQKAEILLAPVRNIHFYDVMNLILVLCILTSSLTYYLILAKSPKEMKLYRYYLLNFTTWNTLVCLYSTVLFRSEFISSVGCSISKGLLASCDAFVVHIFVSINAAQYSNIGTSLIVCCFYKYISLNTSLADFKNKLGTMGIAKIAIIAHLITILVIGNLIDLIFSMRQKICYRNFSTINLLSS